MSSTFVNCRFCEAPARLRALRTVVPAATVEVEVSRTLAFGFEPDSSDVLVYDVPCAPRAKKPRAAV